MKRYTNNRFLIIVILVISSSVLFAEQVKQEKKIQITSYKQTVLQNKDVIFEDDVEVFLGNKFHICADKVEVDYHEKVLYASSQESCAVKIEAKNLLILCDSCSFDLHEHIGSVKKLRIHTMDGFITAERAERLGDREWFLYDVSYTACDCDNPHWQIKAEKAVGFGKKFIKINWFVLKIGKLPIFALPRLILPMQNNLKFKKKEYSSGFLIPKFYFDYESGFGFKQEYYQRFKDRCHTIIGLDWREQKGFALLDEFEWVRSPHNYTVVNTYYALARHNYKQSSKKIFSVTRNRYWISGKDFFSYHLFNVPVSNLIRLDFGTDKKIGYQFFETLNNVDDAFYNSWISRFFLPSHNLDVKVDSTQTTRKRFSSLTQNEMHYVESDDSLHDNEPTYVKELENRVTTVAAPAVHAHGAYHIFNDALFYRHDLFFDQMFYREQEYERYFKNFYLKNEYASVPHNDAQLLRGDYLGKLEYNVALQGNKIVAGIYPQVQFRSLIQDPTYIKKSAYEARIASQGAARFFLSYGAEWSFPEFAFVDEIKGSINSLQPQIRWSYVPAFEQKHWYFMDDRDHCYAKNNLEFSLSNVFSNEKLLSSISLVQGFEFYKNDQILPIRKSIDDTCILPLQMRAQLQHEYLKGSLLQEFDIRNKSLISTEAIIGLSLKKIIFNIGYLFQQPQLQLKREFLSNISHFMLFDFVIPIGSFGAIQYAGQFYVEKGKKFLDLMGIKPLLHTVRFEYTGHCCGFYIGYEEKKYSEFGHNKCDRAIIFALRVDSLGSFAKKFKRPQVVDQFKISEDNLFET